MVMELSLHFTSLLIGAWDDDDLLGWSRQLSTFSGHSLPPTTIMIAALKGIASKSFT